MADYAANRDLSGWVSGNEIVDSKPLIEEVNKLSAENAALKDKIIHLENLPQTKNLENKVNNPDFSELKTLLQNTLINLPKNLTKGEENMEITLLKAFDIAKDELITGVTNDMDMSDTDQFVFFNLSPKLQIHGLVDNEKVPGVRYRRSYVTPLGIAFLAYLEKSKIAKQPAKPARKR